MKKAAIVLIIDDTYTPTDVAEIMAKVAEAPGIPPRKSEFPLTGAETGRFTTEKRMTDESCGFCKHTALPPKPEPELPTQSDEQRVNDITSDLLVEGRALLPAGTDGKNYIAVLSFMAFSHCPPPGTGKYRARVRLFTEDYRPVEGVSGTADTPAEAVRGAVLNYALRSR